MAVRYSTGEVVEPGDLIRYFQGNRWLDGRVTWVVSAGTQVSETFICEHDGVFFRIHSEKGAGLMLDTPESGVLDEDYELVARHDPS